jgi:hypothetical protein
MNIQDVISKGLTGLPEYTSNIQPPDITDRYSIVNPPPPPPSPIAPNTNYSYSTPLNLDLSKIGAVSKKDNGNDSTRSYYLARESPFSTSRKSSGRSTSGSEYSLARSKQGVVSEDEGNFLTARDELDHVMKLANLLHRPTEEGNELYKDYNKLKRKLSKGII